MFGTLRRSRWTLPCAAVLVLLTACESPPPGGDGGLPDAQPVTDGGAVSPPMCSGLATMPPATTCDPLATDYAPAADDMWAACISDDGEYHRIQPDISSIARVMAFDEMRSLFDPTRDPSPDEFLAARLIYQRDQGIDSRVVRRYDPHFTVPDGTDCTLDGVPAMFPDYCVGPARLGPSILASFMSGVAGGDGEPARVHAARIEASLAFFFAISTYKESLTCTGKAKDCDSAYAYYTGGEPARGGLGLAALVSAADPAAHDRAWDGALALRCWRDLDSAETATDLVARDRARAQYDRAVTDGLAAILRAHLVQTCSAEGAEVLYHWAFAQTLGSYLDRALRAADPAAADALAAELTHDQPERADAAAAVAAVDAVFDCP